MRPLGPIARLLPALILSTLALPALACPENRAPGQALRFDGAQLAGAGQTLRLTAGGPHNLDTCAAPGRGWVPAAPQFTIQVGRAGGRDLTFRVDAPCDTVLLVADARGAWQFNDDTHGLDPAITLRAAPDGAYAVWLGTYGQGGSCAATLQVRAGPDAPAPVTPSVTAACPDPGQDGRALVYDARQLAAGQRVRVTAGGPLDLRACPQGLGLGYIIPAPDFTLTLPALPRGQGLELVTDAVCDPVLLARGPDGRWHFNDDHAGLDSRLHVDAAPPGAYDIWVGTYGRDTCAAELILRTGAPATPPPVQATCPNPGAMGRPLGVAALAVTGSDRAAVRGGGSLELAMCGLGLGQGRIPEGPQFTLDLPAALGATAIEFRTESVCDPVLLVHGPDGRWHYNDDDNGLNPRVTVPGAAPGLYRIWVGNFGGGTCDATLVYQATLPPPPQAQGTPFAVPMLRGERVDWCATWGTDCGQGGADAFCRSQGLGAATAWAAEEVARTWVIGSAQICDFGACGALRDVVCAAAAPEVPLDVQALADPGNLVAFRSRVGETFAIRVMGAAQGSVWGSDVYTDDSVLARAAVHAGLVAVGQTAVVQVTILPGQPSYAAATRNGVDSAAYGAWSGSYAFAPAAPVPPLRKSRG